MVQSGGSIPPARSTAHVGQPYGRASRKFNTYPMNLKFNNGVTSTTIAKAQAGIVKSAETLFAKSLALGAQFLQVRSAWKDGTVEAQLDEMPAWDDFVKEQFGKSRSQFNKLCKAAKDAEEQPALLEEYLGKEEDEPNVERWAAYVKDDANSEEGEETEVRDVATKYCGQMQVGHFVMRMTPDGKVTTECDEDDIRFLFRAFAHAVANTPELKDAAKVVSAGNAEAKEEVEGYFAQLLEG